MPNEITQGDALAGEYVEMTMNRYAELGLPQQPLCESMISHAAVMLSQIIGAGPVAQQLRDLAGQIELGLMPSDVPKN